MYRRVAPRVVIGRRKAPAVHPNRPKSHLASQQAVVAATQRGALFFHRTDLLPRLASHNVTSTHAIRYDDSKAGLKKVNKAYVKKVIAEATGNSLFNLNEEKRQKERDKLNKKLVKKAHYFQRKMSSKERKEYKEKATEIVARLEKERDLKSKVFIHVDMDMFYAAVEERKNPSLKNIPFAVGSNAMLSTSNYIARQYGVRSGMPGFVARKLCPFLKIVPNDMEAYKAEAAIIRDTVAQYDPLFVSIGLDEVTLDVTRYLQKRNQPLARLSSSRRKNLTPEQLCEQIRSEIYKKTRLTCSAGIGPTPAFSKLASNFKKPNGQYYLKLQTPKQVLAYMKDLPIRQISGIGFAQENKLKALKITKCKHFLKHKDLICYLFRDKTAEFYLSIGLGVMKTHVDRSLAALQLPPSSSSPFRFTKEAKRHALQQKNALQPFSTGGGLLRKSVGKEKTLSKRPKNADEAQLIIFSLLRECHETLVREGLTTQAIVLVVKDFAFQNHTFSATLPQATADLKQLHAAFRGLLKTHAGSITPATHIRLLGVRLVKLQPAPVQKVLKAKKTLRKSSSKGTLKRRGRVAKRK